MTPCIPSLFSFGYTYYPIFVFASLLVTRTIPYLSLLLFQYKYYRISSLPPLSLYTCHLIFTHKQGGTRGEGFCKQTIPPLFTIHCKFLHLTLQRESVLHCIFPYRRRPVNPHDCCMITGRVTSHIKGPACSFSLKSSWG